MIALFATICYWFFELLTPPDIRQIRYITLSVFPKYCHQLVNVSQKYRYQLVMKMTTRFQAKMWFRNTIFISKLTTSPTAPRDIT